MRNNLSSIVSGVAAFAAFSLAGSALASPVVFDVSAAAFTPGAGYGAGLDDLGVNFVVDNAAHNFSLSNGGSQAFKFGTITLADEGFASLFIGGAFINPLELNGLGVTATFDFSNPLTGNQTVTATGTASLGFIADSAIDYRIDWNDVLVNFGVGGQFRISMNDLAFNLNNQSLQQDATITLLSTPVPEPGSIALVGIALLGLGLTAKGRKRAA